MANFNQFNNATTTIKCANFPQVATEFKKAMLSYQYASNCEWYERLKNATLINDIFGIFGIKFSPDYVNKVFIPVIENVAPAPNFKEALKAVAPYMNDGSIYVKDDYRYYTITFTNGEIKGTVRKVGENPTTPANNTVSANNSTPVKVTSSKTASKGKKYSKKEVKKEAKKFEFTAPTIASITSKRADNTYTVAELVRELLKQMDAGNASKRITVQADFLFENEATA